MLAGPMRSACGNARTRIVTAKPSDLYSNLDECIFRCDCGEEATYMILRLE